MYASDNEQDELLVRLLIRSCVSPDSRQEKPSPGPPSRSPRSPARKAQALQPPLVSCEIRSPTAQSDLIPETPGQSRGSRIFDTPAFTSSMVMPGRRIPGFSTSIRSSKNDTRIGAPICE